MPVSIWTLAAALMWTAPADAQMQTWNIDPAHTSAQFSVRQMGISTLRGAFTKVTGLMQYDTANLEKTQSLSRSTLRPSTRGLRWRDNDLRVLISSTPPSIRLLRLSRSVSNQAKLES